MVNTLYIAAAGTASLDFRDDGNITGITIVSSDSNPGNVEVSFNSSASYTTNDTTGVVAGAVLSGAGNTFVQTFGPMKEAVSVGERVFVHSSAANPTRVFIYTDAAPVRSSARRR